MRSILKMGIAGAALLGALPSAALSQEMWEVLLCNPAPTCVGDCRPWAVARPQPGGIAPAGCMASGSFPSFEFARRNADVLSGRMPAGAGFSEFDRFYADGDRYRKANDLFNARLSFQNAATRAGSLEEFLYAAHALMAVNDMQGAWNVLSRARDLAKRKAQMTVVGDAFAKAGRADQAQQLYERARMATQ